MVKKKEDKKLGVKDKILQYIEEHRDELGDDYTKIKEKITDFKDDVMSKEEVKEIEEWIKKHPFLTVALGILFGAAMHKILGKGGD